MNFEIRYNDNHTEVMNYEDTSKLIDELEMFERDDVNMIHRILQSGKLGKTIWTEEEGLLVSDF